MKNTKEGVAFGLSALALTLIAVGLIFAIVFVGWAAGGWFKVQDQKRQVTLLKIQNQQFQASPGTQQGLREDISTKVGNVATLTAQISAMGPSERPVWVADRLQETQQICADAAGLTTGTALVPTEFDFIKIHCNAGAAVPTAPYPLG